jgi:lambda family phage portal protein
VLPDGETTSTQPYRLRLQLLEADRVGNPMGAVEGQAAADGTSAVGGIRRHPVTGRPVACHIYRHHPGDTLTMTRGDRFAGDWVEFFGTQSGRRRVLHHYRPTRPEQSRGVPYLAPVIQAIKDLGRYTEAEITAAIISAFFTTFVKTPQATGPAPVFGLNGATGPGGEGAAGDEIRLEAGAVIGLAPGEDIVNADPSRPNPNAEGFLLGMLKLIGVGLNLPFELLLKSFNSSFSASKAALLDAWMHFRTERNWVVNSACQPVLETWLTESVAIGRIKAPGFFSDPLIRWAYTRAAWHGDSQGSINPKDEVAAYLAAVDGNLMTQERAEWELFGTDWTRTFETKKREKQMVREAGMVPAPKAGAAAPTDQQPATDKPDPQAVAMQQLGTALGHSNSALVTLAQAAKAQAEQVPAAVHVNVEAPEINVNAGDVHTHVAQAAPAAVEEVAAA